MTIHDQLMKIKEALIKILFRTLSNKRVTWKFIIEKAPWWGGFWERPIQSMKRCIKKIVGRTSLDYHELDKLVVEVERIINSRPLTHI